MPYVCAVVVCDTMGLNDCDVMSLPVRASYVQVLTVQSRLNV